MKVQTGKAHRGDDIFPSVENVHHTTKGHREVAFRAEGATGANAGEAGMACNAPRAARGWVRKSTGFVPVSSEALCMEERTATEDS